MPLPALIPAGGPVPVQHTTFAVDAVARYVCSTWQEATGSGGAPFSAIVIGAGMYGAYCAAKLFRIRPDKRILLLDAGRFLVSEHVQNLARIGFNVPSEITPSNDPGQARELVWGIPWRGNVDFPGLAYCTGGKSIFWGGWCPRLTPADLQRWPAATRQYLDARYLDLESEIGVVPAADFVFGELFDMLNSEVATISAGSTTSATPMRAISRCSRRSDRSIRC